jgi:hypothetical protein
LAVGLKDVERQVVGGQFGGERAGGTGAGHGAPLQRLERQLLPGPHEQFAIEDQAVRQLLLGRGNEIRETVLEHRATTRLDEDRLPRPAGVKRSAQYPYFSRL